MNPLHKEKPMNELPVMNESFLQAVAAMATININTSICFMQIAKVMLLIV